MRVTRAGGRAPFGFRVAVLVAVACQLLLFLFMALVGQWKAAAFLAAPPALGGVLFWVGRRRWVSVLGLALAWLQAWWVCVELVAFVAHFLVPGLLDHDLWRDSIWHDYAIASLPAFGLAYLVVRRLERLPPPSPPAA